MKLTFRPNPPNQYYLFIVATRKLKKANSDSKQFINLLHLLKI